MMFFVYVDFTDDGRPFYVGKGNVHRVSLMARSVHHDRVAKKYGIHREVVLETPDEFEAFNREIRLISELHTYAKDPYWNGIGTNHTVGGDGAAGKVVTAQARANMSAAQRKMTPETKAKMSAAKKNMSAETRQKISSANRKRKHSPETRAKMSATRTGKKLGPISDEARQNMSLAHRGKPNGKLGTKHTLESRAKMSAAHRGKKLSDATRQKMSESQRSSMTNERRDKLSKAATIHWIKRRELYNDCLREPVSNQDSTETQEKFDAVGP